METHTGINNYPHSDSPDKCKIGMTIKNKDKLF
jgi:hypothetical protein